ncbi:TetR/AcrR family transcriptional regulator C-terminal ligand-binding domain-containing protein [Amycolatopsis sp. NBC_00345]|uniref:TetR/AcrR family transcriptional regulator C-terminal ligand-binding domain-containing protein n=1 Tax=Amycolatopsis sp. NBC_00345 TaxID=2975955 RepID=UPI002E264C5E
MVTEASEPVRRRRHGEQLESALLAAGWDELVEAGYARLTMESVAARARTGSAVLYRRWANKDELVLAAIEHHRIANPVATPDTGALRGDLLAQLTAMSEALAGFFAVATAVAFSGLLAGTGLTPAKVRDKVMDAQALPRLRTIYQRAHDRGEIDLRRIPPAVLAMPFDLARHDLLMDLEPLKPARIRSIVDELFLPLVRDSIIKDLTNNSIEGEPDVTGNRSFELFSSIMGARRRAVEEWVRARDLSFEQAMVIGYLERRPGAIQRDIAGMSRTTAANVSLLLKGLERRGLVERRTESGDERTKRVYATPAGITLIAGLDAAMAEVDKAVFAPLNEAERSGLEALLDKINAGLPQPAER